LNNANLPKHVGIIMDGNGRWAVSQNRPRTDGHTEGLKAAKRVAKAAADLGIGYLSLYAFSTENWKRTEKEVKFLMGLVSKHLLKELQFYKENQIRVVHSGHMEGLPSSVQNVIEEVMVETARFKGLTVNLAINYGGQDEIVRSVNKILQEHPETRNISLEQIEERLDNPDIPPVDLIVRTAGEKRLSNFLLWESAYAEFYFSDKPWPEWSHTDLLEAIEDFTRRKRRYGGHD
jgi:undecaprenyl diphosphate synthase